MCRQRGSRRWVRQVTYVSPSLVHQPHLPCRRVHLAWDRNFRARGQGATAQGREEASRVQLLRPEMLPLHDSWHPFRDVKFASSGPSTTSRARQPTAAASKQPKSIWEAVHVSERERERARDRGMEMTGSAGAVRCFLPQLWVRMLRHRHLHRSSLVPAVAVGGGDGLVSTSLSAASDAQRAGPAAPSCREAERLGECHWEW
mmetsp:Transcript_40467/g.127424  ORF Transcript_40467/g.127424 Transcript_40467/m.127424 type:complete len:202 (-) Transcript_40467:346-951(-)